MRYGILTLASATLALATPSNIHGDWHCAPESGADALIMTFVDDHEGYAVPVGDSTMKIDLEYSLILKSKPMHLELVIAGEKNFAILEFLSSDYFRMYADISNPGKFPAKFPEESNSDVVYCKKQ